MTKYIVEIDGSFYLVKKSKEPKAFAMLWPEENIDADFEFYDIIDSEGVYTAVLDVGRKQAAIDAENKAAAISAEYASAEIILYSELFAVYETTVESAIIADLETAKLMSSSPQMFDFNKTFARASAGRFVKYEKLNDAAEIKEFADAFLAKVVQYSVLRLNTLKDRDDAVSLLQLG